MIWCDRQMKRGFLLGALRALLTDDHIHAINQSDSAVRMLAGRLGIVRPSPAGPSSTPDQ